MWHLILAVSLLAQDADLEKRYLAAFDAAHKAVDASRKATEAGNPDEAKKLLDTAAQEVEGVVKSLEATGKPPYKNAKHYKKAELRTREILRRIDTLLRDASFEERDSLKSAHDRVTAVHEKLLEGVMSKKP